MEMNTGMNTSLHTYEALAERLRALVHKGGYQPGQCVGSEHQLARDTGVSRVTVRRASELLIREGLLERRPGKGLFVRGQEVTTRQVQVVAGNLQWASSLQVSRGVQAAARQRGIQVQLYDAHGDMDLDLQTLAQLPEAAADGAVIVSLHHQSFNESLFQLKAHDYPFVLVDQRLHDIEVPSVTADNRDGGYQVGRLLLAQGHRRIAFIGDLVADTVRDRLEGLRDAVSDAGLPFDRNLVFDLLEDRDRLGDWSEVVAVCTRQAMGQAEPPTAIFYSCDALARAGYRTLAQLGLRVPQDVSVVGFDDDPLAEWLTPALTTVRQPFQELGRSAMELLTQRMVNPQMPIEHRTLPVELVQRASVAPPRR